MLALHKDEFAVFTNPQGLHAGRVFVFKCHDRVTRESWIEMFQRVIKSYSKVKLTKCSKLGRVRHRVREFYMSDGVQCFVAGLISLNFLANICESALKPTPSSIKLFSNVDLGFTVVFTLELLVNMFATVIARTRARTHTHTNTNTRLHVCMPKHAHSRAPTYTHVYSRTIAHLRTWARTKSHTPVAGGICAGRLELV
jgi:hypothetical protein